MAAPRPSVLRLVPVLDFGGVESRIVTQAALMDPARIDFRICTFWKKGEAAARIEAQGVRVDELGVDPSPRNPEAFARLAAYVLEQGFDVVHASILEANIHAAMLKLLPGAPAVAIEEVGMLERSTTARVVFGGAYHLADVVIGVSQKTCEAVRTQHWIPSRKVRLIYNAINPRFLDPIVPSPERVKPILVAIGRLVEVKNHASVLRGLARLPASERPYLKIAGAGPLREDLDRCVRDLGLEEHVELLGFQTDVRGLLDAADGYVMSSFSEGTSISLAEAMARGRPVLTSRADGIDEAMVGYESGWQVDPLDIDGWATGLRRLATMPPTERARLGTLGRKLVDERMSVDAWRTKLEALYFELGATRRAPGRTARLARRLVGLRSS